MTIGIYAIEHIETGKKYVGKSLNIERRLAWHRYKLNQPVCSKDCNRHLWNSVQKFGWTAFTTKILETFDSLDEAAIAAAELRWMDDLRSCERDFGYNLRRDSSTGMVTHPETRLALSQAQKARRESAAFRYIGFLQESARSKKMWAEMAPGKKTEIGSAIAARMQKYHYAQCDMNGRPICVWRSTREILSHYPEIHIPNVHSVADGHKGSYMGFIWEKVAPDDLPKDKYYQGTAPEIDFSKKQPPTPRFIVEVIDPELGPIEQYDSVRAAAEAYGMSYGYVSNCVNGRVKEINGYIFKKRDAPYIQLQQFRKEMKDFIFEKDDLCED